MTLVSLWPTWWTLTSSAQFPFRRCAKLIAGLLAVALNLKEKPDAEQDNIDRFAVVARSLQMFS